jgi:hypothetical protein
VQYGIDEREVGERLGKVPEVPARRGIELLAVQAKGAAGFDQPFAELASTISLTDLGEC